MRLRDWFEVRHRHVAGLIVLYIEMHTDHSIPITFRDSGNVMAGRWLGPSSCSSFISCALGHGVVGSSAAKTADG